jgi:putative ABC transport system ATP-binding protein
MKKKKAEKTEKAQELIIEDISDTAPDIEEDEVVTDHAPEAEAEEAVSDSVPKQETADDQKYGDVVIDMKHIVKRYFIGQPNELEVLHGIDMQVRRGEFVAVVGQSGSGKSTLMNVIGALDRPTEGEYTLDGVNMFTAKDKDLSAIRCKKIGFVFQTYNLVARTSALKNVELPMLYSGMPISQRNRRAKELLAMVEMEDRMKHQPDELSGGQKQRVAIARAMANDPAIILADEPTGALDSGTGRLIMDIFHRLHDEQGKTIILITHSGELAEECERILTLKDGLIINERKGSGRSAVS